MSVFLVFLFYRVFKHFSAMGVQKHHKKPCTKRSCRILFRNKSTSTQVLVLGVSRRGEFENTTKQYRKHKPSPGPFWPLTRPPTTGVADLFLFKGPLI
jgi:hypothetical protein